MKFFHSVSIKLTLIILTVALSSCFHNNSDSTNVTPDINASAGSWSGTWFNTTFGSQGPLTLNVTDNGDDTLTVTVDLDGFVGGMFDPAAQTITATINADGDASFSGNVDMMGMLGQLDFTLKSNGDLTISLPNIPIAGFDSFTATGTMSSTISSLNYTVFFTGGGSAVGTASATKS